MGAGLARRELGPGAGEPGPSHCAAPTSRAGELVLPDEPGWRSHFLVRFFYIPKKNQTKFFLNQLRLLRDNNVLYMVPY